MSAGLIILAAGGTGGHVFPAEALAQALLARGHRLALITDRRGHAFGGTLGALQTHRIRAGGIAGRSVLSRLMAFAELGVGLFQARALLKRLRPIAVVGFGGYASVPTVAAAQMLGLPTAIHEQNAVLGRANRLLSHRVQKLATSYASVERVPAAAKDRVTLTGMPVRPAVQSLQASPYEPPAATDPIRLLIMGGSQGARILSQVVPAAIGQLPEALRARVEIAQQCRPEDLDEVQAAYARLGVGAELASFFQDAPARIAHAHLVITRSGASTMAELTALGRPSVLVPYQFAVDDHQTANARAIEAAGGAWRIQQTDFTPEALTTLLTRVLGDPAQLAEAARKARAFGKGDAAERLADLVDTLPEAGS